MAELYAGVREGEERTKLDKLVGTFHTIPVTEDIARWGGLHRRHYLESHGVDLADALIAATAKSLGADLVTLNKKHFSMISCLVVPYLSGMVVLGVVLVRQRSPPDMTGAARLRHSRHRAIWALTEVFLGGVLHHPVSGNLFAPADPHVVVALHVVEKPCERHRAGRMATGATLQPSAHRLRTPIALLPQQSEGILEKVEEVISGGSRSLSTVLPERQCLAKSSVPAVQDTCRWCRSQSGSCATLPLACHCDSNRKSV